MRRLLVFLLTLPLAAAGQYLSWLKPEQPGMLMEPLNVSFPSVHGHGTVVRIPEKLGQELRGTR